MLNLRCSNCGLLHPITSPYQTFCPHCNKKLTNNFSDWHKLNPDKSFDDFKILFGLEEQIPPPKKNRSRQSRFITKDSKGKNKVLWGVLIGFILMVALITFAGRKAADFFEALVFKQSTPEYYLTREWKTTPLGEYGLTLSTPVTLKEVDMGFPKQLVDLTDYLKTFKNSENEPVQVLANVIKYKVQVQANLQGAADGAVNEIKSKPGVAEFEYSETTKTISTFPGILQTGSFSSQQSDKIHFYDLIILHDHNLWQVVVFYREGDDTGKKVAERIMDSVQISPG